MDHRCDGSAWLPVSFRNPEVALEPPATPRNTVRRLHGHGMVCFTDDVVWRRMYLFAIDHRKPTTADTVFLHGSSCDKDSSHP
jgi:hypothetical protein